MTSYKILVVDDEYSHVENVIDYCELQGWTAKGASNPFEAQDLLAHERFDLMVLDVTMPGKDGMTYCEELRSHGIALPILMCTANQDVDDRVRGTRIAQPTALLTTLSAQSPPRFPVSH